MVPADAYDIALDVGHFIEQPGVIGASGAKEWELNRRLAIEISGRLVQKGISHHLIGQDGKMSRLTDRAFAARTDRLFLSIHHDSIQPEWMPRAGRFRGFSLFVSRKNHWVEDSLACARKIGAKLLAAGFQPSGYHALPVQGENRPFADERTGVHYFDDLVVLKSAHQPAVLIEAGVIVNPVDELKVTSREGRQRLANAIASGAAECLLPKSEKQTDSSSFRKRPQNLVSPLQNDFAELMHFRRFYGSTSDISDTNCLCPRHARDPC